MFSQTVLALAIVLQPGSGKVEQPSALGAPDAAKSEMPGVVKTEKPIDIDKTTQRRVFEAYKQARFWVNERVFIPRPNAGGMRKMSRAQLSRLYRMENAAKTAFYEGAARQICEAYNINRATLKKVMRDPWVTSYKFIPEPSGNGGIRMMGGAWDRGGTRFDPSKIVIDEKIAKAIGYVNPDPNAEPEEPLPPVDPNFINPIPGDPDGWRKEVERRRRAAELEKRAAEIDKDKIRRAMD